MKPTKLLVALSIFSCLVACERSTIYTREDFIDRTLELATFLTDNYAIKESSRWSEVEDSLLFKTEEKGTTTFYVLSNSVREDVYYSAWDEGSPVDTIYNGFILMTELVTKYSEQSFIIEIHHGPRIHLREDYWTDTYARLYGLNRKPPYDVETGTYAPYEWEEIGDTISIVYSNMTCVLKKNVGIVKFTCDEHSWELVQ